jgi:Zn-dependent peptidase ImmA (M78 family)
MATFSKEEHLAEKVLEKHWPVSLPVNPESIAIALGATIKNLQGPESGRFCLEDGRPVIYVNRAENDARQRFTIAHEIGHWQLKHGNAYRDTSSNFSDVGTSLIETEANRFAACLLMPRKMVINMAKGSNMMTEDMARAFNVSRLAIEFRLKNLGLING